MSRLCPHVTYYPLKYPTITKIYPRGTHYFLHQYQRLILALSNYRCSFTKKKCFKNCKIPLTLPAYLLLGLSFIFPHNRNGKNFSIFLSIYLSSKKMFSSTWCCNFCDHPILILCTLHLLPLLICYFRILIYHAIKIYFWK